MKKTFRAVIIALMVFALVFLASCSKGGETAAAAGTETEAETEEPRKQYSENAGNVNPKGVLPIVKEPITLRMAIQSNPMVTDFQDNDFTRWVEETTGIRLEIEVIPAQDVKTKINLLFAAGEDLPDIITCGNIANDALYKYALDGMVIPMDPYFEDYGEHYMHLMDEQPGIREAMTAPDGHIYGVPKYTVTKHNMLKHGKMYLYKPWLDKLGLDVPKTVEELYDVLKAFKTQDPNGNGIADEIPMAGASTGAGTDPVQALMDPFIPFIYDSYGLLNVDGKITPAYMEDEFREGLEYISRLVKEKLVDPVSFTQTIQQLKQLANREEVILGGYIQQYTIVNISNQKRVQEYVCLDLLESGTGRGGFLNDPLLPKGASMVITKDCRHPEAAYRLADFMLSFDAAIRNRHGVEGRDWEYIDQAEHPEIEGLVGGEAKFRIIDNVWGDTGNVLWRSECAYYYDDDLVYARGVEKGRFNADRWHHDNSMEHYLPYVVGNVVPLSSLFFTEDELGDYSLISVSLHDHLRAQIAAFATGTRPIGEFDAFREEMRNLGLEEYLGYIQKAYDRQFGSFGM